MSRILVLGAAGQLGHAAAEAFHAAGWQVASVLRGSAAMRAVPGTEIIEVDARDREALVAEARDADIVLNALNPPYTRWAQLAVPFAETAIAAARAAGATLVFPGNVYIYGAGLPGVLNESTPMQPTSRKGAIRVEIEARLRQASAEGLRVIILRAGDFFGGPPTGSWFARIVARELGNGRVTYPGPLDVLHEWAYLPDLAAALVRLVEARERLGGFAEFGFSGHAVTGRELVAAIGRAVRREGLGVSTMPWWLLRALAPVVPIFRELSEMAYLWREPHRIDGRKLAAVLGGLPHTPFDQAIAAALRELGFARR
jgi:nucleoside-diphosphate-sugar epimerase